MILFFGLFACSQDPFVFKRKPNQCRKMHALIRSENLALTKTDEEVYQWDQYPDGLRVEFQAFDPLGLETEENYQVYNAQGFLMEEGRESSSSKQVTKTEYDCDEEFCWRISSREENESRIAKIVVEKEYSWDGKTETYKSVVNTLGKKDMGELSGYTIHNDYGYPIKEYHKHNGGYKIIKSEYSCGDGWCKLQKKEEKQVIKKQIPFKAGSIKELERTLKLWWKKEDAVSERNSSFSWRNNRQEWKHSTSNGYRIYNDHGYVREYFSEGAAFEYRSVNTYDCE